MRGTRGILQSSSNPCLRQYPFISLPSFVRLQISFSTLNMHANGGFKINWADFVHVYNLVPRILWILWLRNCTFSTFLLSTLPNLLHLSNLSNPAQRMRGRWIIYSSPSDIFCIPVKKSLLKLHDEPIECLQASKWREHLFNNNGLVIITKAEIVVITNTKNMLDWSPYIILLLT